MVNRCAITVRVKQPFLDWLLQLPEPISSGMSLNEINKEPKVYLIPDYTSESEKEAILGKYYHSILEHEREEWCIIKNDLFQHTSLEQFKEWFDIEFHSIIEDLLDEEPLLNDDE